MKDDVVFLSGHLDLVDDNYRSFLDDPDSVEPGWRALFQSGRVPAANGSNGHAAIASGQSASAWPMIHHFRERGHLYAHIDPLDMLPRPPLDDLLPSAFGFSVDDLVPSEGVLGVPEIATAGELADRLAEAYCSTSGLEYLHVVRPSNQAWLAQRTEQMALDGPPPSAIRMRLLEKLIQAEVFESFIHTKYPGTKRFSLEGAESLVPMVEECFEHLATNGAIEVVVGMAHRGRLNVLVHNMGKAPRDLFSEFDDVEPDKQLGGGDVKYHMGYSCDYTGRDGDEMHVSLSFNPSHLEAVDPIVVGRVRAKQRRHGDWERRRIAGLLIHGDAAFAGQGLVPETLQLSNLHGYRTGGTIHLIVNNQIGFTATAAESRSTTYCTDIAKMLQCPIWHVNGEDPDRVAQVCKMAADYRAQFQSDVVIDMLCYRKFGHNEMDEPNFTQPVMYGVIEKKDSVSVQYAARLIEEGVLTEEDVSTMRHAYKGFLQNELDEARAAATRPTIDTMRGVWERFVGGDDASVPDVETGLAPGRLREVSDAMAALPDDLHVHRKIQRLLDDRAAMGRGDKPVDWGMAELLAYGSLLWEGHHVRLSGQDSARGTFSHRHALIVDTEDGHEYMPLGYLHRDQGECRIYDSPLSEAGVLGFEFGYSLDFPDSLVIWEAQFGDFVNGAQVIIDQFIIASEDKWNRLSGLVLLLPHGYEGQGPEHSSARIERFLQSAAEDNIQICQPSTPAQMFHLLRRQIIRPYRKPLVIFTPKSLLRLPAAVSDVADFASGTFQRFLAEDGGPAATGVERIFLCSGRVYYDLVRERESRGDERTAIVRVEQLYPWRRELLQETIAPYNNVRELVWIQDEPSNMGPAQFVAPRLRDAVTVPVRVVSRVESASPATGSSKAHAIEQAALMERAFAPTNEEE